MFLTLLSTAGKYSHLKMKNIINRKILVCFNDFPMTILIFAGYKVNGFKYIVNLLINSHLNKILFEMILLQANILLC